MKGAGHVGMLFKGRYETERELGRGGVGIVYLARDKELHSKQVVVKVLLEESLQDLWYKKKFLQEGEALARLDHPGIVAVTDSGETPDKNLFLVMQYIKGGNLRSLIRSEGMDLKLTAQIVKQVGQALSAAHEHGILHCDLKPENIMLQDLGKGEYQVKLVDFGVAKIKKSESSAGDTGTRVAGTLPYVSAEQLQGRPSAASDIFAFGVIAYEMLTGRRPFNPFSQYQILETLKAGVRVKPQDLRPDLPLEAQDVILQALAFNAEDRPSHARDFGGLLAQALTADLEMPSRPTGAEGTDLEMAHVLFMDIVGYSKLPTDHQTQIVKRLQLIVGGTDTFRQARKTNQVISRATGDGMALVFFSGPQAPVECAMEIARVLRLQSDMKLRMGINSGPVYRVNDMNQTVDVAGAGINMAQRVMDCGDADHILLSKSVADVLKEIGQWREHIHDLGEHKVKHNVSVQLFNLYLNEAGNPAKPEKVRKAVKKRKAVFALAAIMILVVTGITALLIFSGRSKEGIASRRATGGDAVQTAEPEQVLSYWLTVQKYRSNRPVEEPFQLADAGIIFEENFRVRLNVTTPQPGYFYVLNEPAEKVGGSPHYVILYPATEDEQKSASSQIAVPDNDWFEFDDKRGREKLWIVWSDRPVPELEVVKGLANSVDMGKIKDTAQTTAIEGMLTKYSALISENKKDDAQKRTNVKARSSVIVYPINLEHR